MWEYQIKVIRIIDGDTVDARVDLGFYTHRNIRVRLNGIDTYETRTRDAEEKVKGFAAKARLEELLEQADKVIMLSHGLDKFGRCLGSLYLEMPNQDRTLDVAQTLIDEGHGVPYHGGKR